MATTQAPDRNGGKSNEVLGRLPIIDSPFARVTEHWFSWQSDKCADTEFDFARCAARVGGMRAPVECKKYHDDFIECAYRVKTFARYKIMQNERRKQGLPYMERPPPDSIRTWLKED